MERYNKALYVYNGNLTEQAKEQELSQTAAKLAPYIKELKIVQTEDADELYQTCREYAPNIDLLIIHGGDGTVHQCINAIAPLEIRPKVAILPGGTCNDFSRMLGLPQNLGKAANALITGETRHVDIGQSGEHYFLNFWGIGLIAETSQNIDSDQKSRFGVLSYFISTLKTVNQAEPFTYKMEIDEELYEGEAVMLLIMNGRFIGTREMAGPHIRPDDGNFDVFVIKNSTLATFRELLSIKQERTDMEELTEIGVKSAKKVRIIQPEGQDIDMDGEIYHTTPETISILPGHIEMLVPQLNT